MISRLFWTLVDPLEAAVASVLFWAILLAWWLVEGAIKIWRLLTGGDQS